ncbi:hypothetical protein [Treponema primitia]|uniref:hypothetical protein n=1 Tax=Treponema primitia TaxID=88058 RepID=UPI0002E8810F|nr:hypothetical protein [Treponema primitia]
MKIEQRIGRIDRIGQKNDVYVYNFILADTVENRVKKVLETKLQTILAELGIDKYSDVLDTEISDINYTKAYMDSIIYPSIDIENNVRDIEQDFKIQIENANKIKNLMKESKQLENLVGKENIFDIDTALSQMIAYFENSKGNNILALDDYSLENPIINEHINKNIVYNINSVVLNIAIQDFSNEKGYFIIWSLTLFSDKKYTKYIPLFINDSYILRPLAGQKIWDAILNNNKIIISSQSDPLNSKTWEHLEKQSMEYIHNIFIENKKIIEDKNEENYNKYMYVINARLEAAENIGIDHIKKHKVHSIIREREEYQRNYSLINKIIPDLSPVLMVRME